MQKLFDLHEYPRMYYYEPPKNLIFVKVLDVFVLLQELFFESNSNFYTYRKNQITSSNFFSVNMSKES